MENGNTDGYGESFINKDGRFVIRKWGISFSKVLKRKFAPLSHLPYNGWTIVHERAATHGSGEIKSNSHPFLIDNKFVGMHNGVLKNYEIFDSIFRNQGYKFSSMTDSEVAFRIFSIIGPKNFLRQMESSGVYVALNKNGSLDIVKTSGQLEFNINKNGSFLIASDLSYQDYPESVIAPEGLFRFNKDGYLIRYINEDGKSSKTFQKRNTLNFYNNASKLPVCYQSSEHWAERHSERIMPTGRGGYYLEHSMD